MKKSQFIHIEEYSLSRKGDKPDAIGVLKEANREESHSKHILVDKDVRRVFGKTLKRAELELRNASYKKINGRSVQARARVLLAGVASYPIAFTDSEYCAEDVKTWVIETTRFLKEKFGKDLQSVVLHRDETFPHLHFYCYDLETMSVRKFHPGIVEESKCRSKTMKARKSAFVRGLRLFQDQYYELVSKKFDMKRNNDIKTVRLNKAAKAMFDKMKKENKENIIQVNNLQNQVKKRDRLLEEKDAFISELKNELSSTKFELDRLKVQVERMWETALKKAEAYIYRKLKFKAIMGEDDDFGTNSTMAMKP